MTRALFVRGVSAFLGGLALFLADYPVSQPWLALAAFVPLLWLVLGAGSRREAATYGVLWGLGRTVPLAVMLSSFGLPLPARFAVEGYLLGLDALFALIAYELRAARAWPVLVAIAFAAIEYADSRLPMWGTARAIARLFSPYPSWCGLVRSAGVPAVAFALVVIQACFVSGARQRKLGPMLAGAFVLVAAGMLSIASPPGISRTLRVAAVGRGQVNEGDGLEAFVAEAARRQAKVVVFPEVAFELAPGMRAAFEAHWSRLARENAIFVVVPFVDEDAANGNRLMVFDDAGRKLGEYTKRHLVPLAESSSAGTLPLLLFDVDGVRVGTLICQDDNFSDLARDATVLGARLLLVPTFEGPAEVAPYHLRNSALRAIENPTALVRSVAQGVTAVIAPGGKIVDTFEPKRGAAGVLVSDVPIATRE